MGIGSTLRSIGWVVIVLGVCGAVVPFMPRDWFATEISETPRSMMASGFVNDHTDVGPWTWPWSGMKPLEVDDPENTTIVIWNHHTEAMETAPTCFGSGYFPPPAIIRLERMEGVRVYYLCTKSTQGPGMPHFAIQRRDEILELVRGFRALGVPAGRIFLAGQSGGSCSSLFALGAAPEEMNAGILFAPACFGRGEGVKGLMRGQGDGDRAAVAREMLDAKSITALMVAFGRDAWNRPKHLRFMTERYPGSVRLFSPGCAAGHGGAFSGCAVEEVAIAVEAYFLHRLQEAGYPVAGASIARIPGVTDAASPGPDVSPPAKDDAEAGGTEPQ